LALTAGLIQGYSPVDEVKSLVGRFAMLALVIDGEMLLGFGLNMARVRELLQQGVYLSTA